MRVRHRRLAAVAAAPLSLALLLPAEAGAAVSYPATAKWPMRDTGSTMRDATAYNNDGEIGKGVATAGKGFRFRKVYGSVVSVPHDRSLNPRRRDFKFGATVKFTKIDDANIMQKGYWRTDGGQYKLGLSPGKNGYRGRLACWFRGAKSRVERVTDTKAVNDGDWHKVRCKRKVLENTDRISIVVDGRKTSRIVSHRGRIWPGTRLTIGAKRASAERGDHFVGRVRKAVVRIK